MTDIGAICLECPEENGSEACKSCGYGNPCLGCKDYDWQKDTCKSNGGCGMTKLEYCRLELDNHIGGLEISKSTGYWTEDDERTLNLMLMIKEILSNVEIIKDDHDRIGG